VVPDVVTNRSPLCHGNSVDGGDAVSDLEVGKRSGRHRVSGRAVSIDSQGKDARLDFGCDGNVLGCPVKNANSGQDDHGDEEVRDGATSHDDRALPPHEAVESPVPLTLLNLFDCVRPRVLDEARGPTSAT
jgi:hypothetical protein